MVTIKNVSGKTQLVSDRVLYPGETRPVSDVAAQSLLEAQPADFEIVGAAVKKKKRVTRSGSSSRKSNDSKKTQETQPPLEPTAPAADE